MEGNGLWSTLDSADLNVQFKPTQFPNPKTFLSNLIFFLSNQFFLDYTQYIPICQVLKHIKNPQKYPNMVDKLIKNVYNVWIIWGKELFVLNVFYYSGFMISGYIFLYRQNFQGFFEEGP